MRYTTFIQTISSTHSMARMEIRRMIWSIIRMWKDSLPLEVLHHHGQRHFRSHGLALHHHRCQPAEVEQSGIAYQLHQLDDRHIMLAWVASSPRKPHCLVLTKSVHNDQLRAVTCSLTVVATELQLCQFSWPMLVRPVMKQSKCILLY